MPLSPLEYLRHMLAEADYTHAAVKEVQQRTIRS